MKRWILAVCLLFACTSVRAEFFDHSAFDALLQRTVDDDGFVDYQALERDHRSALESYLERIGEADLAGWPRADREAFFINAYNARMLLTVLENPGLRKVSERFALFNKPFSVAGQRLTLNDIEFRLLLNRKNPENGAGPVPMLSLDKPNPAVHFALVCGAKGCPRLLRAAYTADSVEDRLRRNAIDFANDAKYVDEKDGRLYLSSILRWYAKDFATAGGVARYLAERLDGERRGDAEAIGGLLNSGGLAHAEYHYDWSLNAQPDRAP
jgi:hypothetical protein